MRGSGLAGRLDDAGRGARPRELGQQPRGAVERARLPVRIDAALEAVARLAVETEPARRLAHARRMEVGALEEHVLRPGVDLALGAAHHAGERHRASAIGDHEVRGLERPLLPVEGEQPLAGARRAHAHAAAPQPIEIEGVERLAELEHHQVGDVHDVVDAALARGLEARRQPGRRRRDAHAPHDARRVAVAAGAVLDLDAHVRGCRAPALGGRAGREQERPPEEGAHLARDPEQGGAVAAIGRDLEVEDGVAGPDHLGEGAPDRRRGVEHEDAGVVVAETELSRRANHPVRGDAADLRALDARAARELAPDQSDGNALAGGHVRRPAHDLERLADAHVDAAHGEAVGVGVLLTREHVAHAQRREIGAAALRRLDLEAARNQARHQLLDRREVDPLGEPGERDAHQNCSSTRTSPSNSAWMLEMP